MEDAPIIASSKNHECRAKIAIIIIEYGRIENRGKARVKRRNTNKE